MRKRRMRFKALFWVILAVVLIGGVFSLASCETSKTDENTKIIPYVPVEKDYILDIPYQSKGQFQGSLCDYGKAHREAPEHRGSVGRIQSRLIQGKLNILQQRDY